MLDKKSVLTKINGWDVYFIVVTLAYITWRVVVFLRRFP